MRLQTHTCATVAVRLGCVAAPRACFQKRTDCSPFVRRPALYTRAVLRAARDLEPTLHRRSKNSEESWRLLRSCLKRGTVSDEEGAWTNNDELPEMGGISWKVFNVI